MHKTAMEYGAQFFDRYVKDKSTNTTIVDVGSHDVNGSLRSVAPILNTKYIGIDFNPGNGVDIVLDDPYVFPFDDNFCDVVVSSSCFEHSEFFWLTFNEIARIVKPNGYIYINVPMNCPYHSYPVDCWRFLEDSGRALERWAIRSGYNVSLIESFIGVTDEDKNNDFVAVFRKES